MTATTYLDRYRNLVLTEQKKNLLIEVHTQLLNPQQSINVYIALTLLFRGAQELLQRVAQLEDAYEQEKLDHEREKRFNRDIQVHEMELMGQVSRFQLSMVGLTLYSSRNAVCADLSFLTPFQNRQPYIIVLLDGSGFIFKDAYLKKGTQGGKLAAQKLHDELEAFNANQLPSAKGPKLLTRMYINVKALSETCIRGGITTDPSLLQDFIRGFNSCYPSVDIVDTGAEADSAHNKIAGKLLVSLHPAFNPR